MEKDLFLESFLANLRYQRAIKYISKNSIVCDIGCGPDARFLRKITPQIKYGFGFDPCVKNQTTPKFKLQKLKIISQIPLPAETINIITMMAALEHLEIPQTILDECFRILKENGKLIITTPTPQAKPILEFLAFKLNLLSPNQIREHQNYFHPNAIKQMLTLSGFRKINIKTEYFEFGFNSLIAAKK